ncbi:hypothetical protein, partial [Undibacterium sp. RuTC16W]
ESIRQVAKVEESYIEPEVSPEFETQDNSMSVGDDSASAVDTEGEGSEIDSSVQVIKGSELSTDAELTSTTDATLDESGEEELIIMAPVHTKPSLV